MSSRAPSVVSPTLQPGQQIKAAPVSGLSRRDRAVMVAGLASLSMGNAVLIAVLAPLAREIGIRDTQVGVIHACAALAAVVAAPVWGRLADRRGQQRIFALAIFSSAVSLALIAAALTAGRAGAMAAGSVFAAVLCARIVYGLLGSGGLPAAAGLVARASSVEMRSRAMTLPAAAFALGSVAGGIVVLPSVGLLGPTGPLVVVAAFGACVAMLGLRLQSSSTSPVAAASSAAAAAGRLLNPPLALFLALVFAAVTGSAMVQAVLPFHVQDRLSLDTAQTIGLVSVLGIVATAATIAGLAVAARQLLRGRLQVFIGLGLAALGASGLLLAPDFVTMAACQAALGFGFGLFVPATQAALSLQVTPERQSEAAGLMSAATTAGYVVGPVAAVYLYTAAGVTTFGAVAALLVVALAGLARR